MKEYKDTKLFFYSPYFFVNNFALTNTKNRTFAYNGRTRPFKKFRLEYGRG